MQRHRDTSRGRSELGLFIFFLCEFFFLLPSLELLFSGSVVMDLMMIKVPVDVTDPKVRRRRQNRLNQRARRK